MVQLTRGTPFNYTAGSVTQVTVTVAPLSYQIPYITDINFSTDKSFGTAVVSLGTASGTVIWQTRIGNTIPHFQDFQTPLIGTKGTNVVLQTTGSLSCTISVQGVFIDYA